MPRSKVAVVQFIISIFCDRWNIGTSYKITSSSEPYHFPRLSFSPSLCHPVVFFHFPHAAITPNALSPQLTSPFFISVFIYSFVSVSPAHLLLPPITLSLAFTLLLFSFLFAITSHYLFVSFILHSLPHTLPRHFPRSAIPCVGSVYLPADN